jgi:hypothetical protein
MVKSAARSAVGAMCRIGLPWRSCMAVIIARTSRTS